MKNRSESKKFRQLQAELQNLIISEFQRLHGSGASFPKTSGLTIELQFSDSNETPVSVTPSLIEQIRTQLRDLNVNSAAFTTGKVYCYLHESSECSHCFPNTPSKVMSGYQPNGIPQWDELLDVLIDEAPEQAAAMFSDKKHLTAVFMKGRDLKRRLLPGFGRASQTYNILGQVVAGFFFYRPDCSSRDVIDNIALTLQAVEFRNSNGQIQLELNILSGAAEANILDCFVDSSFEGIRNPILRSRRKLKTLQDRLNSVKPNLFTPLKKELMPKIPGYLQSIRSEISRFNKQKYQRTKHAEDRRREQRPVFKAVEDAFKADAASILEDKIHKTFLVPGKRFRWHVFNREGQLVTSLYLSGEQVAHRKHRERWTTPSTERLQTFLTALHAVYRNSENLLK